MRKHIASRFQNRCSPLYEHCQDYNNCNMPINDPAPDRAQLATSLGQAMVRLQTYFMRIAPREERLELAGATNGYRLRLAREFGADDIPGLDRSYRILALARESLPHEELLFNLQRDSAVNVAFCRTSILSTVTLYPREDDLRLRSLFVVCGAARRIEDILSAHIKNGRVLARVEPETRESEALSRDSYLRSRAQLTLGERIIAVSRLIAPQ